MKKRPSLKKEAAFFIILHPLTGVHSEGNLADSTVACYLPVLHMYLEVLHVHGIDIVDGFGYFRNSIANSIFKACFGRGNYLNNLYNSHKITFFGEKKICSNQNDDILQQEHTIPVKC